MADGAAAATAAADVDEHVRVRRGATTAFVCVDVAGGAMGGALRGAAAAVLGFSDDPAAVRLLRDGDRAAPLKDDVALSAQGVAVDNLVWAVCKSAAGVWETPQAAPESTQTDALASKVPRSLRM